MKAPLSALFLSALLVLVGSRSDAQRASAYHGYGVRASHPSSYARARVWIPGQYETVHRHVWVPGCRERVWIDPVYELRFDSCGGAIRVLTRAGHWKSLSRPGRYELRPVLIWRPGHWTTGSTR